MYKRVEERGAGEEGQHAKKRQASQSFLCTVLKGGIMSVIPDPVTCFRDASYRQVSMPITGEQSVRQCHSVFLGMHAVFVVGTEPRLTLPVGVTAPGSRVTDDDP